MKYVKDRDAYKFSALESFVPSITLAQENSGLSPKLLA